MPPAEIVDAVAAATLVEQGAVVLDARGGIPWMAGHIPGSSAVSWRVGTRGLTSGALVEPALVAEAFELHGVHGSRPVLVVGDWDASWGEEGRIAWDLAYLGHPDVNVLAGGMAAWTGPLSRTPATLRRGDFDARPREELRVTRAEIEAGGFLLVDVREPDEFAGAVKYGEARGGHIAGARSLPWRGLLTAVPDLPRGARIATYCTGGVRSAMAWLRLVDLGYTDVGNYDGSWWEWSREEPALP